MSIPFKTSIDLEKNELLNARIQNLSSDPTTGLVKGLIYFNTTSNVFRCYNGTKFEDFEPSFTKNTAFNKAFGNAEGTVCQGNDVRLSDSRTPTAHAATHISTGTDAIAAAVSDGASGLMTGLDKKKLDGIAENANNYSHPTASGSKHVPSGGAASNILSWKSDGTAQWEAMSDTLHGQRGGGTQHSLATQEAHGFMNSADKKKLDEATNLATASKLILRDSSGKARVVAPLATDDVNTIATKGYVDGILNVNDALQFKGVIDCSASPNYPAADAGHIYVVSVAGKIGGSSGAVVEAGDKLMCLQDSTAAGNHSTVGSKWNITQANIDGAVIGPATATSGNLVEFNGDGGKLIKDSGKKISDYLPLAGGTVTGAATFNGPTTLKNIINVTGSQNIVFSDDVATPLIKTLAQNAVFTLAEYDGAIIQLSRAQSFINSNFKPYTTDTYSLGDSTYIWKEVYSNAYYIGTTRKDLNWDSAYTHSTTTSGNPHSVTATNVGLGSVNNYDIATTEEAEAGTVNNKYMTPARTKEAILELTPAPNLSGYLPLTGGRMTGRLDVTNQNDQGWVCGLDKLYLGVTNETHPSGSTSSRHILILEGDALLGPVSVVTCGTIKKLGSDTNADLGTSTLPFNNVYSNTYYIGSTRKDLNWDTAYTHSSATGNPHGTTKANLGIYSGASDVGDNSKTSFTITHNCNTRDLVVLVRSNSSPYEQVFTDIEFDNLNSFTVKFAVKPASSAYRVIWHKV